MSDPAPITDTSADNEPLQLSPGKPIPTTPVSPSPPGISLTPLPLAYASKLPGKPVRPVFNWLMGVPMRDFWIPLILLCIGGLLFLTRAMLIREQFEHAVTNALAEIATDAAFAVVVYMCFGRWIGIHLGPAAPAVFKLSAIAVFPPGVCGLLVTLSGSLFAILLLFIGWWLMSILIIHQMFMRLTETDGVSALLPAIVLGSCYFGSFVVVHLMWL